MTLDRELLTNLLQIERPCVITDFRLDAPAKRLDVWIGIEPPAGWFGRSKSNSAADGEKLWRHVNVGNFRCYVHAPQAVIEHHGDMPWLGDGKQNFTRAKGRQILNLLSEGVGYEGICSILEVPFDELWKFKFAVDKGSVTLGRSTVPSTGQARRQASVRADSTSRGPREPNVPEATDPIWQELLEGRFSLDIRVLSFQLMLARLRTQISVNQDTDVKMLKLRELQRYIVKNERVLGYELAQLHGRAA
jgi:hypothetical protein